MRCPSLTQAIFTLTLFIGCSRPAPVESTTNTEPDSADILEDVTALPTRDPKPLAADTLAIRIEKARDVLENTTDIYEVSISAMQYEASSDVTWNFDKDFSPLYFKDIWAMEGMEGTTEYFIVENNVHCKIDEDSYGTGSSTTKWCRNTGGTKTTYDDDQGREQTDALAASYEQEVAVAYAGKLSTLIQILKNATLESDDSEIYKLKIENKPYEGDDFVETTSIRIPKALYDELIK